MIYEPREDSYLLTTQVKKYARGKVLDMGSGSGIQAESALAEGRDVLAADIDTTAVKHLLKKNIQAVVSDLFSNIIGIFDTIIFNPPYLPEDKGEDEEVKQITTGGKRGHELIQKFLHQAKEHLAPDGKILMVCSSLTGDVEKIMGEEGYSCAVLSEKKLFFETLRVYLLKRKL